MDCLTILPDDLSRIGTKPDAATARWAQAATSRMSNTFARVALLMGRDFVPVGQHSKPHHAWSESPWTQQFRFSLKRGVLYHLNRAGMRAMASLVTKTLDSAQ